MRKICFVTGTRAEFGILYSLMKKIQTYKKIKFQLIVTGAHLSREFGLTYKEIEKDFFIDKRIEMLLSSDSEVGISKSMGLAQISLAEAYKELNPDIVVLVGDRYEILCAASAAMIAGIPIAHIHGGELTQGAFDDAIRHSITKMSHLHFVATETYRKRVIQLGEKPETVFNFGAPALDNLFELKLLSKTELEKSINFKLGKKNILVTFHPVTLEKLTAQKQFQELLKAIDNLKDTKIIFTKANADVDGRIINQMIDTYVSMNPVKSIAFESMGQFRYFSILKFMDVVVGNSSSGLVEVPSFKIGTINIGDRQKGRIKAASVIDCKPIKSSIIEAIDQVNSFQFKKSLDKTENPYAKSGASKKIADILVSYPLQNILKKEFYDLPGPCA